MSQFQDLNPYQTPGGPGYQQPFQQTPQQTPGKLLAPAIALTVVSVINVLYAILNLVTHATGMANNQNMPIPQGMEDNPFFQGMRNPDPTTGIVASVVMIVIGVLIGAGGYSMMVRKAYPLAIAASVLSILPCGCCSCTLVGNGIGIWALVILLSQDVRVLFR